MVGLVAGGLLIAAAAGVPTAILVSRTGSASPSPSATPTPAQSSAAAQAAALYREAIQAAESSSGFHYVATSSGGGSMSAVTGDAGQNDGDQVFSETSSYGDEKFTLRLTPDQIVYFQGNVPALEDQLGVSSSAAPGLAGKWVSVRIGDGPYRALQAGITVDSQLSEDSLDATSTRSVTGAGGTPLTRISGTLPTSVYPSGGTGHLDVAPSSHLPATYVASATDGTSTDTSTTTFSRWGVMPSVTAPAGAVAWSTLSTSAPPGGYGSGQTPSAAPTPTPSGAAQ